MQKIGILDRFYAPGQSKEHQMSSNLANVKTGLMLHEGNITFPKKKVCLQIPSSNFGSEEMYVTKDLDEVSLSISVNSLWIWSIHEILGEWGPRISSSKKLMQERKKSLLCEVWVFFYIYFAKLRTSVSSGVRSVFWWWGDKHIFRKVQGVSNKFANRMMMDPKNPTQD